MHPMRLLQADVQYPLVNVYCSLNVILQGQVSDYLAFQRVGGRTELHWQCGVTTGCSLITTDIVANNVP